MKPLSRLRHPGILRTLRQSFPALIAVVVGMLIFPPNVCSSQSTLVWDPSPDPEVIGYRLHYGNSSRAYFPAVEVGSRTTWTVSDLIEGIPYFFAVTAHDRYGNQSDYSEEVSQTIYENTEDLSTAGWDFCPADCGGAEIQNVFDASLQRNVIELRGSGTENCYRFRRGDFTNWDNAYEFTIAWRMKFAETFRVFVTVETTAGLLRLRYVPTESECEVSETIESRISCGVGSQTTDGEWHHIVRNLQSDVAQALPGTTIVKVKKILVRGSGRLTDVKLLSTPP